MADLDWYRSVDEKYRQRAYELAWFLCPDHTTDGKELLLEEEIKTPGDLIQEILEKMKEILWSEEKSKRGWGSKFEVVVDGEVKASLDVEESDFARMTLPSSARYVEIRDKERDLMVANCHLIDPQDLPTRPQPPYRRCPRGIRRLGRSIESRPSRRNTDLPHRGNNRGAREVVASYHP